MVLIPHELTQLWEYSPDSLYLSNWEVIICGTYCMVAIPHWLTIAPETVKPEMITPMTKEEKRRAVLEAKERKRRELEALEAEEAALSG